MGLYHRAVLMLQMGPQIGEDLVPLRDDRLHGCHIYVSICGVWVVFIPPPALLRRLPCGVARECALQWHLRKLL